MNNIKTFIKNCSFCKIEFSKSEAIKIKKNCLLNNKQISTTINNNIIRCNKCRKCFSCINCKSKLKSHYEFCLNPNCSPMIFSSANFSIEFEFVLLPDILGGYIVNVCEVCICKDFIIYKFLETGYIMLKLLENNLCCWINDKQSINLLTKHKLKISIGEQICHNVLNKLEFNNKEAGYFKFKKIRPNWLKSPYSNYPLELDFYNEELKIAVEYNGEQHYKYTPLFHQNEEAFKKQLQRDEQKVITCSNLNINLIIVPYSLNNYKLIEEYITSQLKNIIIL